MIKDPMVVEVVWVTRVQENYGQLTFTAGRGDHWVGCLIDVLGRATVVSRVTKFIEQLKMMQDAKGYTYDILALQEVSVA